MTLKKQWKTIRENWLLIAVALLALAFVSFGNIGTTGMQSYKGYAESAYDSAPLAARGYMYAEDFAPELEDRIITKTARLSTEVERGTFSEAEQKLKNVVDSSDSFLLNENVNKYDNEKRDYFVGYYNIKVESQKYDSVISQLKEIGEVQEFNENTDDITGQYTNLEIELETEKSRLKRYQEMYEEAESIEDKIELNDRIFNQERLIKYYEERLASLDTRVDYSTVSVTISEKQSEYVDAIFVKFSELVTELVRSVNSMLKLLFIVLPYAIVVALIAVIVRFIKRKK
jgi:hypothetical protein